MALKELTTKWMQALDAFDKKDYNTSLKCFNRFADLSKIHFNIAMIQQKIGNTAMAIDHFDKAIELDSYFSLAYFQRGVVFYYLDEIELALDSFKDAHSLLRKNSHINYTQLGLEYSLYESYCLFNVSMCLLLFGDDKGLKVLQKAQKRIVEGVESKNIKKALKIGMLAPEKIAIYELSPTLLFRPPKDNILNEKKVNHLGESKLIAASSRDNFQGFSGRQIKEKQTSLEKNTLSKSSKQTTTQYQSMKRVIPKRRQASRPYSPPKSEDSQDDYFLSPTSTLSNGSSLESASSFKSTTNSDTVKIKAYFLDCRIIKCDKSITFSELKRKLREKFKESRLRFKYKDGNTMAVMHNDDDLLEAIGDAKVIELFCYLPSG